VILPKGRGRYEFTLSKWCSRKKEATRWSSNHTLTVKSRLPKFGAQPSRESIEGRRESTACGIYITRAIRDIRPGHGLISFFPIHRSIVTPPYDSNFRPRPSSSAFAEAYATLLFGLASEV
jgi:hypothetical protein